ncbi:hypothetical protein ACFLRY_02325 [Bacteroidota bacterium]
MKIVIIKYSIILPVLLFLMYISLVLLGCISCVFGATESYYCNQYCTIAKITIGVIFAIYLFMFLRALLKAKKEETKV